MKVKPKVKCSKMLQPKQQQQMQLLALCWLGLFTLNAVAAEHNNYGASFISNPAIYAYTVANQQQQQQQQLQLQQQQQQQTNNRNYINFASSANTNYRGASNRNYYYTNSEGSSSGSSSTAASMAASTLLPPISSLPPVTQPAPQTGCTLDRLAVYKVVLHTYWTRDLFPKHYPDWRPTAQWTKTLGRTHNANYALYHIGQQATLGVKQFAETGKSDQLDSNAGEQQQLLAQSQAQTRLGIKNTNANANANGERSVFDEFSMPAIQLGAGRSEAKLFVDSNHSLVSLMTRIVPSPDWFIGVDSFELCVGGSWIDTVTVELDPLDAGTDNGFTFTAPNWPTAPQGVIYRITSRYPAHPAGSFYYPKSKRLPPIATFQFIKLKEYELSEVFNIAEDDRKYETVKTQTHLETEHNHVEMNNELSASIERERQTEFGTQTQTAQQMETERQRIRTQLLARMNPIYSYTNNNNISQQQQSNKVNSNNILVPKNDKQALMQSIANSYRRSEVENPNATVIASSASAATQSQSALTSTAARRRASLASKRRRDCRVSHWSEWTACSKTCGIGEMHRYRKVIKHGKRGGRPCPALQQSKWCGSERGCHEPESYFNWSDT